jgi:PAS domain S-box-containing protein
MYNTHRGLRHFGLGMYNRVVLAFIIMVCVFVTLYANLLLGIDAVYTHLYYLPIILAGIWYHRKSIYLALFLGLAHVSIGYYIAGHIVPSTLVRAVMFLVVAAVVSLLSERRHTLYRETRLLLESTGEGIYGIDLEGRCTFINDSAVRMLGYSPDEMIGKSTHDLIHCKKKDGTICVPEQCGVLQSIWTGVGCRVSNDIFWKKDGRTFPVEYSSYVENDVIKGAVVTFNDISERIKAEEEILEAKKRSDLYLDIMGHDINNMNQVGIGYLDLLLETLKPGDKVDKDSIAMVEKSLNSLENSSRLISNVRTLQEVETGKVRLKPINLCDVLSDIRDQYSRASGRSVTIDYSPSSECILEANELLRDTFSNIVGNAVKHSDPAKPLAIDIRQSRFYDGGKEYYKVIIDDNGPGIPDELKNKLFTKFQRGQTRAQGKGLGLYLVKALVEDFRGRVWVEDRVPGDHTKGCRFVVMLPAHAVHASA